MSEVLLGFCEQKSGVCGPGELVIGEQVKNPHPPPPDSTREGGKFLGGLHSGPR